MKKNIILNFFTFIFSLSSLFVYGQRCDRQDYSPNLMGNYDFELQSLYAKLLPEDTSVIKTVIYGRKAYRIYASLANQDKPIHFKIVFPKRVNIKTIKAIQADTTYTYKTNDEGKYITKGGYFIDEDGIITNENGDEIEEEDVDPSELEKIAINMSIQKDTLFDIKRITKETVVYDSETADKPYWETRQKRTKRIFIYVYTPKAKAEQDLSETMCVGVMIGQQTIKRKGFSK
jgi:hypothetical protein